MIQKKRIHEWEDEAVKSIQIIAQRAEVNGKYIKRRIKKIIEIQHRIKR